MRDAKLMRSLKKLAVTSHPRDDDSCYKTNDGCVVYYSGESSAKGFSKTGASKGCKAAVVYYLAGKQRVDALIVVLNGLYHYRAFQR
jgi:hypothetical protein